MSFTLSLHSILPTPRKKIDLSNDNWSDIGRRKGPRKNWSTRRVPLLIIILIISVTQSTVRVAPWLPASIPSSNFSILSPRSSPCLTNFLPSSQTGVVRLLRRSFPPLCPFSFPPDSRFLFLLGPATHLLSFLPSWSLTAGLPTTAHLSLTINDRLGKNKLIAN